MSDEPAHRVLSFQRSGGRRVTPGSGLPVSRLVGHGPIAIGPVVEVGEIGPGGQTVGRHGALRGEGRAVEVADEVLPAAPTGDGTGVDVDDKHPLAFLRALHFQLEQVGAFPLPANGIRGTEVAQMSPVLQVRGLVEQHSVLLRLDGGHHPIGAGRAGVAEDLRVSEVRRVAVEDGVARVLRPGLPGVEAVGQRLGLLAGQGRVFVGVGAGVDRH